MNYRIELLRAASRAFEKLPKGDRDRVAAAIGALATEPRPAASKKLVDLEGLDRVRAGDYRVVYSVDDVARVVTIEAIAHRGDAYRRL